MSRILLVEDDVALRNSVRQILERNAHQVRIAADGAAGVRELESAAFDVVLLDIGLPFVDGWRILGTLEGRRIPPVIVISARGEERDKVRALDMGADELQLLTTGQQRAEGHQRRRKQDRQIS